jgi:carboxymethylenebutenolidase
VSHITLPSGTEAFAVRPARDPADLLGVVVIPDIFGLRPLFEDMATRLSEEHGWPVAVIDPFPGRTLSADVNERFEAMSSLDDQRLLGDIGLAASALGTPKTGCIGFCMGGMYALKVASTGTVDRSVAFYGMIRIPLIWRGGGQGEPLEHLGRKSLRTKVLAIVGGKDPYTPSEDVAELRKIPAVTVAEYPEAEHGFVHDPSRPAHRPADAADAWARAVEFLRS